MADVIRVAVTGAAGQVAYAMLGRLASGEVFGANRKIVLQLLEIVARRADAVRGEAGVGPRVGLETAAADLWRMRKEGISLVRP